MVFAILAPILHTVAGFIGGLIAAALCNLVAKWTGGLEFEVSDDATGVETALQRGEDVRLLTALPVIRRRPCPSRRCSRGCVRNLGR